MLPGFVVHCPCCGARLEAPPCFDMSGLLSAMLQSEVVDRASIHCSQCEQVFEVEEAHIREWGPSRDTP